MRTVLITGARGFTGRYLIPALLARQFQVVGLVEGASQADDEIACDLTDAHATEKAVAAVSPDAVIHLAALSYVGSDNAQEYYRVNVVGTENLLTAVAKLEASPAKILIASSANVYGTPAVSVIDETLCPAPVNHYANSKLAMEHVVRTWFERLPIVVTRPFNYTGPGQDERFVIPKIVGHFRRGLPAIELGNLDVSRDFSDVNDVVAAYVALLESDAHSEIVNICSGTSISLRDVLSRMSALAGYEIEVKLNPELVRENEIHRLVGSNAKLKRLVGFVPSTPFAETLQRMFLDDSTPAMH